MGSINLHLRASASAGRKTGRVFARLIHKRKTLNVSLPYRLYEEEWDAENGMVAIPPGSVRAAYLKEAAKELAQEKQRADLLLAKMEQKGEYTVEQLKNAFLERESTGLKKYAMKLAEEMMRNGQERTGRGYITAVNRLEGFTGKAGLRLEDMKGTLLVRFEHSLHAEGLMQNTVVFYMRILRAIYNKALKEEVISPSGENPFSGISTKSEATMKRALSPGEISRLHSLELSEPRLKISLLVFLFSFLARGIPFVDQFHLKKEDIADGILSYKRKKTGKPLEVKVTGQMQEILDAFAAETQGSPYLLPLASTSGVSRRDYESALRLQNLHLNRIKEICGLNRHLSTHVARHSWATIAKSADMPIHVISEGLGHASVQTTTVYLAAFDRTVLDDANEKVWHIVMAATA